MAEVQVFANRSHTIDSFTGGGVVAARPWTAPYQASVSMSSNFVETLVAGRWLLTVKDTSKHKWYREQTIQTAVGETQMPSQDRSGVPNDVEASGPGQLADWVLLLTDEAGVVTAHYMDISATITHLPKYGHLYADARSLGSGNAWDAISVGRSAATINTWRTGDGRHAQLHTASRFDAELLKRTETGNRPWASAMGWTRRPSMVSRRASRGIGTARRTTASGTRPWLTGGETRATSP